MFYPQRWIFVLFLTGYQAENNAVSRSKRGVQDRFNVLIKLYKIKPLQESNIFKTYSKNIFQEKNKVNTFISTDFDLNKENHETTATTESATKPELTENVKNIVNVRKPQQEEEIRKIHKDVNINRKTTIHECGKLYKQYRKNDKSTIKIEKAPDSGERNTHSVEVDTHLGPFYNYSHYYEVLR